MLTGASREEFHGGGGDDGEKRGAARVPRGEALLIKEARRAAGEGAPPPRRRLCLSHTPEGKGEEEEKAEAAKRDPSARDAEKSKGGARAAVHASWMA